MGDDGVPGAYLILPVNLSASGHHYAMIGKGSTFRRHQVIPAVLFVNMGGFQPFSPADFPIPDKVLFPYDLKAFRIQFAQIYAMMAFIQALPADKVSCIPDLPIVIEK